LIGANANTVIKIDPVFTLKNQIYYTTGVGKIVGLCELHNRSDLTAPCKSAGSMSLERTNRGNYIIQFHRDSSYKYGLWFRSDDGTFGKYGYQCFVWLGDGIVGSTANSVMAMQYGGSPLFASLSSAVRRISTETPINRQQLLQIAAIYEDILSPLGQEVKCIGDTIFINLQSVQIAGDNRHLREYEPGPFTPH
jgi:hypothetical protein